MTDGNEHVLEIRINYQGLPYRHPNGEMTTLIRCPEISDFCRLWQECLDEECDREGLEQIEFDEGDDEPELHGIRHKSIAGDYMTPTDDCYLRVVHDRVWEAASDMVEAEELGPGDYRVIPVFDDGDLIELLLVREAKPVWLGPTSVPTFRLGGPGSL